MGQHSAAHKDANLLDDLNSGVSRSPGLLADADGAQERKHRGNAEGGGDDCKSSGGGVAHVLVLMVDVRSHSCNHSGQTCSLGQVRDNFTPFDSSVVVFVNQERLDHNQNLVNVGSD